MAQNITFDKIVPEGKALAYWHDKALFAIGPLPGETALIQIRREKRGWAEGVVREFIQPAPQRGKEHEAHYLSCSPWQSVDYAYQLELKRGILAEIYARPELGLDVAGMVGSDSQLGYRNKLEFSFMPQEDGRLELSFHKRGSFRDLIAAPDGCVLGADGMNRAALALRDRINELDIAEVAETLTVRQSHTNGRVIAVLLVKEAVGRDWSSLFGDEIAGLAVVRKVKHDMFDLIWKQGDLELVEQIGGVELRYPWDSFFQVNPPAFEHALDAILRQIEPGSTVVDLYGGAGTIGLPVAKVASNVTGIEIVASSVALANRNAKRNKLSNYEAMTLPSEKMELEVLQGADTIILDPPRAGLHPKVVELLLLAKPAKIVYLSCNPVTQARDVLLLAEAYQSSDVTGFDFYPGTLHLESLVTLTRKA
jgi:23S rRNA (uracil1939-C5)-methyltransferase